MSNSTPNQSFSGRYGLMDLLDPRSPTTAFQRTPIQVILRDADMSIDENTNDMINDNDVNSVEAMATSPNSSSLASVMDDLEETSNTSSSSTSFLSVTAATEDTSDDILSSCNPSPIVSDYNTSENSEKQSTEAEAIPEPEPVELEQPEQDSEEKCVDITVSESFTEVDFELKNPAKKLFYTPNKKRTPLIAVDNICPVTPPVSSPQNVLRQKQWKRIQEERKKLGIDDENIPIPMNDVTASAPSKLMLRKKRLQARYNI